jgi:dTDP-4-amino-4,6-dideoxygalactose transaminase
MSGVPLLDIARQHQPLEAGLRAAFDRVLQSGTYILGPEVQALEAAVATYTGTRHAIGLSSGTDALLVALMALDIGPGDEVLCPAFTFFGTAGSVARVGATPVWVDVLDDTFNIDLADAARKVGPRTKALMPVHLFGQPCDMECVLAFAAHHGLRVIEDVAQSIGGQYKGVQVGGFGDMGAISFYPTKNLGCMGDGGMLVTNNDALADKVMWLRNHGMNPRYYHKFIGGNFRLDAIQAAILRLKLPLLESWHAARAAHAAAYCAEFRGHSGIVCPVIREGCRTVWNQFTIRVLGGHRDALQSWLRGKGIGCEVYYPLSLDQQECFQGVARGADTIRVSHQLASEVLSLPVFPELTADERASVIEAVWDFGYHQRLR